MKPKKIKFGTYETGLNLNDPVRVPAKAKRTKLPVVHKHGLSIAQTHWALVNGHFTLIEGALMHHPE